MTKNLAKKSLESVLFMGGAMIISLFVSTISRFTLASQLGATVFGDFAITLAIVGFITLISNTAGDRYLVTTKEDREMALNTVFTTELILWGCVVIAWLLFSPLFWPKIGKGASWGLASILLLRGVAFPLSRPRALVERDLNFKLVAIVNVLTHVLCVVLAVVLSFFLKNELPLILLSLTELVQAIVYCSLTKIPLRFRINLYILKDYMNLCLPLMGMAAVVYLYWNMDRVLLDRLVKREYLGYYAWAFSLGAFVFRLKSVIARVVFPVFAKMMRDGNSAEFEKGLTFLYQCLALIFGLIIPVLIVIAPKLVLLAGKEWTPAITCFQIAILIFSMRTFNSFLEPVFVIYGKSNPLFRVSLLNALIIIGGGYVSLCWFPKIETMAWVILLSCVVTFVLCTIMIRQLSSVNLARVIAPGMSVAILLYLLMSSILFLVGEGFWGTVLAVGTGSVCYVACVWKRGRLLFGFMRGSLAGSAQARR